MVRFVALLALVLAGCGGGKTEIDITLQAEASVTDQMLASVRTLHVEAGDPDPYSGDVTLGGHILARTERLVYKPRVDAGLIPLTLTALDESGDLVACSPQATIEVRAGLGAMFALPLHPCNGTPDFATPMDLLGADLTVPDLGPLQDLQPPDGGVMCPAAAALCEDFETNLSKWNTPPQDGTATIDTAHVHSGSSALHVHINGPGSGSAYLQNLIGFVTPMTYPIYVRAYVWVQSPLNLASGDIVYVQTATSGVVILQFNNGFWGLGNQNLATGSEMAGNAASLQGVAGNAWTCLEWMVDGRTGGSEHLAINGVDDPNAHVDNVKLTTESAILVGWSDQLLAGQSVDLWFDDIVVANTPSGCP